MSLALLFRGDGSPAPTPTAAVTLERPPLRVHVTGVTPGGREFRWGGDEPDPANRISGLRWSSSMPGGWDSMDGTLPREPGLDYADLERLSTLTIRGVGAEVVGEYRLERAPRVSGDQMSVSPSARGWQAALEDDKSVSMLYIDRDLGRWSGPSAQRRLNLIASNAPHQNDPSAAWSDTTSGLSLQVNGSWASPSIPRCEAWYDAGSANRISQIRALWSSGASTSWNAIASVSSDSVVSAVEASGDFYTATSGTLSFQPTARYRHGRVIWFFSSTPEGADGATYELSLTDLQVHGWHSLPLKVSSLPGTPYGYLASDMIGHAVSYFAPSLKLASTNWASSFVIPQAAFHEPTTVAAIIDELNKYEFYDWAVWNDRELHYHPRGAVGRRWIARVAASGLEETGPQADRLWNGVVIPYQDVDGSSRTVGPPGSGADYEDAALLDADPENPANQLNMRRWENFSMGMVSTPAGAVTVGARFLQESRLLDTSGRATFIGYVQDEHGIEWPYHHVRAGDTVTFVDSATPSPRRIVKAEYDQAARSVSVDLDSPPEGLQALLSRFGLSLAPAGL